MEPSRPNRSTWWPSIFQRRGALGYSFKKDFRHHSFVFVVEQMAVKYGQAFDDWISEIHDDVDRPNPLNTMFNRDIAAILLCGKGLPVGS